MGVKIIKDETLKGIADAIRSKTGTNEPIRTDAMAEVIGGISAGGDDRYDEGYNDGSADGFREGFGDGERAEYDRFWDAYQQNGERTDYSYAFSYAGWTTDTFRPKYVVRPKNATGMFYNSPLTGDFRDYCELDMSLCTVTTNAFFGLSKITALGVFDLKSGGFGQLFESMSSLETIEKIILYPEVKYNTNWGISRCPNLKEVRFEGELRQMTQTVFDLSRQNASLSKASIESLINVLSSYATGLSCQILKRVIDREFATSEGANDGSSSAEWSALVATKSNWTISLV